MPQPRVLIVGGYGTVGTVVSEILSSSQKVRTVIAGRDPGRAARLADRLHSEWIRVDITDTASIQTALDGVQIVINCFSGPFTHFPVLLPETAARRGIHYLDVSGSFEYAERFQGLDPIARTYGAILITALGTNPGIPGIAVMEARNRYEIFETARIVFVLGSGMDGISPASLQELKHMFDVEPLFWDNDRWTFPGRDSIKEYVGAPFNREVYMGPTLTRDLFVLPELTGLKKLSAWSGSQDTVQGLLLLGGMKLGLARSERSSRVFLNLLKAAGRAKTSDLLLQIETSGIVHSQHVSQTFHLSGEENLLTALAPAIVCEMLAEGQMTMPGAYLPPQVVPATRFMNRLESLGAYCTWTENSGQAVPTEA